jgi:hypothetical protein
MALIVRKVFGAVSGPRRLSNVSLTDVGGRGCGGGVGGGWGGGAGATGREGGAGGGGGSGGVQTAGCCSGAGL